MRVALSPRENLPHLPFLRQTPGGYEWWYFDAVSDNNRWSLACVWFLGCPFSPFYRLAARGKRPDPLVHNALFFALYDENKLHAYHFTRFAASDIDADNADTLRLRFGPNTLEERNGVYQLSLTDENANRRTLHARLTFAAPPIVPAPDEDDASADTHLWHPAAPSCRVSGTIELRGLHDGNGERIAFSGHGYHDHNRGALPFSRAVRDWYWARAQMDDGSALVAYHVRQRPPLGDVSHLLRFHNGRLISHETPTRVRLSRPAVTAFGRVYFTQWDVDSGQTRARFTLRGRLDSAPFYVRARSVAALSVNGETLTGDGMGEWFAPHGLGGAVAASATKARIVDWGGG